MGCATQVAGCAVSRAQLEEVKDRERMAHAQMRSRQAALEAASASGELKALPAAMAEVQAMVSALRQVRMIPSCVANAVPTWAPCSSATPGFGSPSCLYCIVAAVRS